MAEPTRADLQAQLDERQGELDAAKARVTELEAADPSGADDARFASKEDELDQANEYIARLEQQLAEQARSGGDVPGGQSVSQALLAAALPPDQRLQVKLAGEPTVQARVLFDDVSYKDGDGLHIAVKGDVVDLPSSEFERLTSEAASLPPAVDPVTRTQTGVRYAVERVGPDDDE